jgi:DNA ligase (NAD+)
MSNTISEVDEYWEKVSSLSEEKIEAIMTMANNEYRSGNRIMRDSLYDGLMALSAARFPDNSFFNQLEVESDLEAIDGKTVKLPERMLSTNKAYSLAEIEKWANDVVAVGKQLDIKDIFFRITPKLDGFAAYDDGKTLFTRGDGRSGTDITRAFNNGLLCKARGLGKGEIVVDKNYFNLKLSGQFENSRNIIAGVIKEGEIDPVIKLAIEEGAVIFHSFSDFKGWSVCIEELLADLELVWDTVIVECPYDTDGLVIEALSPKIKEVMGATNHHHRWQIAYKKNTEFHDIKVTGLVWQTSKNGRLTPVVQLEPTKVSGVTISRATGHHHGNVKTGMIDEGAVVRVCRSGLVIPYIESVVTPSNVFRSPPKCPSCDSFTELDGDNLLCTNTEDCPAQVEGIIEFFFKTLGNCDGFGPKVIERLCEVGARSTVDIYKTSIADLMACGFGAKTATNLFYELIASRQRPIEDWRFLAAFSIHNVGKGGCERLLKHHRLADVFTLTRDDIVAIDGFAQKSADSLIYSLKKIKPAFDYLMSLGFNLVETSLASDRIVSGSLSGKTVVFTGSMVHGKRDDMEKHAKSLGAKVGSAVSSKTDYLICGANVGASKTQAAEKNGVTVISEDQYIEMLKG